MARLVKRPEAENDLLDLFVHIGGRSVTAAERFLKAANTACEQLAEMPFLGGICEFDNPAISDLRLWTIRGFRNFVILYRPIAGGVEVVRVVRSARDLESLFE
jgi:toxin ParE1/3/4